MAIIRVKQDWKDAVDKKPHRGMSRRDFMERGLATGAATVLLPHTLLGAFARDAMAATGCSAASGQVGGLAQIYLDGGPTMGATFLSDTQAGFMSGTTSKAVADRYGIVAADVVPIAPNSSVFVSSSSPFGKTIMTPPSGYTAAEWTAVLSKVGAGGHAGAFNQDDGAGQDNNSGAAALFKPSVTGKDLQFNAGSSAARWAVGMPKAAVNGITTANIAKNFGITPANMTDAATLTASSNSAGALSAMFASMFGLSGRKFSDGATAKVSCGFSGIAATADPTYGSKLFDPAQITALSAKIQLANLSAQEQALLASFYQSAMGQVSLVGVQLNGGDYHGQNVQTNITPYDIQAARTVVMFIAACDRAQKKGAIMIFSNGQAIANGVQAVTVNGVNYNGPSAQGDAGGAYNVAHLIVFDPVSALPKLKYTGQFSSTTGDVSAAGDVSTRDQAMAGLYLSAFAFLGYGMDKASSAMQSVGLVQGASSQLSRYMVL